MADANKKPQPLFAPAARAICPICQKVSYSHAGVHPQCAMLAADEALTRHIKDAMARQIVPPRALRVYEKRCPRCHKIQHIRKLVCDCGCRLHVAGTN
jgi:hypothetical protein